MTVSDAATLPAVRALDWFESPVGPLIAAASDNAVCLLQFSDAGELDRRLESIRVRHASSLSAGRSRVLDELRRELDQYFRGERQEFTVPLLYPGTAFQEQVWSALCKIRYGATWSYLDLARHIGDPKAARAVGIANNANPIAIVIPCHRVVNANGDLGGYGGGLWRKRILLDLERGQGRLPF